MAQCQKSCAQPGQGWFQAAQVDLVIGDQGRCRSEVLVELTGRRVGFRVVEDVHGGHPCGFGITGNTWFLGQSSEQGRGDPVGDEANRERRVGPHSDLEGKEFGDSANVCGREDRAEERREQLRGRALR